MGHLVQLVSFKKVLKFEIPLKTPSDFGSDLVQGLLHLGQRASISLSPRNTTFLKRWSQFSHLYSMVGMTASPNCLFTDTYKKIPLLKYKYHNSMLTGQANLSYV
jgi:hypothetical protein